METLKQFHGLPCNCYTRRVLLGLLPDPNADSCPAICSAETPIVGVSSAYTVDGWYLQFDASNLVYMESGVITDTVECASGFAQLVIEESVAFYRLNAVFSSGAWTFMGSANVSETDLDHDFDIQINVTDALNTQLQVTYDGTTWTTVYSADSGALDTTYSASSHNFRWRVLNYFEECPYYLGTTDGICPVIKVDEWGYSIPSAADNGGLWKIYPFATIPSGFTVNVQISTDNKATWGDLRVDYDPALLDGATPLGTGVTYGSEFDTRLQIISTLECINYSVELHTA